MPGSLRLRDSNTVRAGNDSRGEMRVREEIRAQTNVQSSESRVAPMVVLGFKGLIVLWSAWAATMLVAFLLGTSLGRHQGIESALEEYSREAVPQPVPGYQKREGDDSRSAKASGTAKFSGTDKFSGTEQFSGTAELERSRELPKSPALTETLLASRRPQLSMSPSPETMLKGHSEETAQAVPTEQNDRGEPNKKSEIAALSPSSVWTVQAATFRSRAEADKIAKKFQRLKMPVRVHPAPKGSANYFRVVLGPYSSAEKANQAKTQAIRTKLVRGELYIKQAAVTSSSGAQASAKKFSGAERNQQ